MTGVNESAIERIDQWGKKITKQESISFVLGYLASVLIYLPFITERLTFNDVISYGILYRSSSQYDWEDVCGRYLVRYLAHLRSMYNFYGLSMLISLFCLTAGTIVFCRMLRIRSAFGITVSILLTTLSVSALDSYGFYPECFFLGYLLVAIAIYLFDRRGSLWSDAIAILLIAASLALYQAEYFVGIVMILFLAIRDLKQKEDIKKSIGLLCRRMICCLLAIVIYIMGDRLLKTLGLIYYDMSRFNYLEILKPKIFIHQILQSYRLFWGYLWDMTFFNNIWKGRKFVNVLILLMSLILLFRKDLFRKEKRAHVIVTVIILSILPAAVMGVTILNVDSSMRPMMIPTFSMLYVGAIAILENRSSRSDQEKRIPILTRLSEWGIVAACVYLLVISVSYAEIYQDVLQYYADRTDSLGQRVIAQIELRYPDVDANTYVFVCGNGINRNNPRHYAIELADYILSGTMAGPLFQDNPTNCATAWNNYLADNLGVSYLNISNQMADDIYASDEYKEAALFPEEGSVYQTENGVIVVKLKE